MPQFFFNKRLIMLLITFIIFVILIGFSVKDRGNLTWPEQFLKDTTGWVTSVFSTPIEKANEIINNLKDLKNTYDENVVLKSKVDMVAALEAEVALLRKDNEELKVTLEKTTTLIDKKIYQATVISRNPDRWNELITIDKGNKDGIKENMAVITAGGLIGKVKTVNNLTSTVQLISSLDNTNRISAEILADGSSYYGLIEGFDTTSNQLVLKRIPADAVITEGQQVVTSGKGGVFPKGLLIGTIEKIEHSEFGLNLSAYIKPSAQLYDLEHVMVIQRVMINPEDDTPVTEEEGND